MKIWSCHWYCISARLWNENRVEEMSKIPNRTDAYQRCLDRKRSSQTGFDYIRLQANLAVEENGGKPLDAYEIIMSALKESLAEELREGEQIIYSSRIGEIERVHILCCGGVLSGFGW